MDNRERIVQEWWEHLEPAEQLEVISNAYPDADTWQEDDVMWEALDEDRQYSIYLNWEWGNR